MERRPNDVTLGTVSTAFVGSGEIDMAKTLDEALASKYDAIVIGSGFGSSVAITMLAEEGKDVLVLERGTWWGNPEGPPKRGSNKQGTPQFDGLGVENRQWWPRPNDAKGINYMLDSIYKEVDPIKDLLLDWRSKDRDIGPKRNRRGLYRLTRLGDSNGKVDIVSGSGVGGGSLFYSGVNLRPKQRVLDRIGLGHLDDGAFDQAGRWMQSYRGRINKVATTVPVPHRSGDSYQLASNENGFGPEYEMPDPKLEPHEEDMLIVARASLLRDARNEASKGSTGEFVKHGATADPWHPLPLSVVEYDPTAWDEDPWSLAKSKNKAVVKTKLVTEISASATAIELQSLDDMPVAAGHEFSLLISSDSEPSEIVTVTHVTGKQLTVLRGQWHSQPHGHSAGSEVSLLGRGNSDMKNSFCLREGRCMVGCLPSARHTLYKTIQTIVQRRLRQAELLKADPTKAITIGRVEVLPQTKVSHIKKSGDAKEKYEVCFESLLEDDDGEQYSKHCNVVFVGAGTLGTTEIMLRSREKYGLALSKALGEGFSTNGDFFGFAINVDRYEDGKEKTFKNRRKANPTVGPINTSGFNVEWKAGGDSVDINVEDAGIPPMFARFVKTIIPGANKLRVFLKLAKAGVRHLLDLDPFDSSENPDPEDRRQAAYLTERELLSDLFFFNTMGAGPDEPLGTFRLDKDESGLQLRYSKDKKLHDWAVWDRALTTMKILTSYMSPEGANGSDAQENFVPSPFWKDERRFTVVHPLGGCTIGTDKTTGALDSNGRVYDESGTDTLSGLYVVDGSAISGALGVNPTLTIVAQAVRTVINALDEMKSTSKVG